MGAGVFLRGLPPNLPFNRLERALRGDLADPPLRPASVQVIPGTFDLLSMNS